ncbi:MAG: hypothetical protein V4463_06145 [Pseudomonadota bacterium]
MKKLVALGVLAACVALACFLLLGQRAPQTAAEQLEAARVALQDNDYARVKELAGQVVLREPKNGQAWYLRAQAQCMLADTDGALVSLEQAMHNGVRDFNAFAANHNLDPARATPQYQWLLQRYRADAAAGTASVEALPVKP